MSSMTLKDILDEFTRLYDGKLSYLVLLASFIAAFALLTQLTEGRSATTCAGYGMASGLLAIEIYNGDGLWSVTANDVAFGLLALTAIGLIYDAISSRYTSARRWVRTHTSDVQPDTASQLETRVDVV